MKTWPYKVVISMLTIVICYSLIFNILPKVQQHISFILLEDDISIDPSQQQLIIGMTGRTGEEVHIAQNSRIQYKTNDNNEINEGVLLTFFDNKKFSELKVNDGASENCIATTLQVFYMFQEI